MCWGVCKEKRNKIFMEKETKIDIVFHKCLNALIENYTRIKGPIPSLCTKGREKIRGKIVDGLFHLRDGIKIILMG